MTPLAVSVRGLCRRHGKRPGVADLDFDISSGEILGLLGGNGAGKTTTIETLGGILQPDAGNIRICGIDAQTSPRAARAHIGVALQSAGLLDKITAREALAMFGAFHPSPVASGALLERFGLGPKADAPFDSLSGGQKQRLNLALALVGDPAVILLDEPTTGLDPQMRGEFHDLVRQMRRDGRAVLLATHDMDEGAQLCDRIAILDAGHIIATGSPAPMIERFMACAP